MKLKIIFLTLAAAALGASAALAAPPAGKGKPDTAGKPPTTGAGCRPQVAVVLSGTLAATPGSAATSVSVTVKHASHQGAAYVKLTQPVSVNVTSSTKISRQGSHSLSSLLSTDRVTIHTRPCKADLKSTDPAVATATLTATRIDAHPAKP